MRLVDTRSTQSWWHSNEGWTLVPKMSDAHVIALCAWLRRKAMEELGDEPRVDIEHFFRNLKRSTDVEEYLTEFIPCYVALKSEEVKRGLRPEDAAALGTRISTLEAQVKKLFAKKR